MGKHSPGGVHGSSYAEIGYIISGRDRASIFKPASLAV